MNTRRSRVRAFVSFALFAAGCSTASDQASDPLANREEKPTSTVTVNPPARESAAPMTNRVVTISKTPKAQAAAGPNIDWNVATTSPVLTAPAVAGGSFTAGTSADVFAFAVSGTGTARGINGSGQLHAGWAAAAADGGVFVLTNLYDASTKPDLLTYALDNDTGQRFTTGGLVFNSTGTKLYALSASGKLFCFAIPTGGPVGGAATRAAACTGWTDYTSGANTTYSGIWPVYDTVGLEVSKIYFGDDAGRLNCVNGNDGSACWGAGTLGIPTTSPLGTPIVVYDTTTSQNVIYVGDNIGRFFRIRDNGASPSSGGADTSSYDLCGSAPGTCSTSPWGVVTSATIDTTYNKAYVASGGYVFEFPVSASATWQPSATAKTLLGSATTQMYPNPMLDPDNLWLYQAYNNRLYKVRYPFDGNATSNIYSTPLQKSGPDSSYPRATPLVYQGTVWLGTGTGTDGDGIGEKYQCGGASHNAAPALVSKTAVTYGSEVTTPFVFDFETGNVNWGYRNAAGTGGGAVQYKSTGSPDWECPSGQSAIGGLACGSTGCGVGCSIPANCPGTNQSSVTCASGVCGGACSAGFADCNGNKNADGCETNTTNNVSNCGACGTTCSTNHITPTCTASACGGTCDSGYANCNGLPGDGCEVATSCGNCCSAVCGAGQTCLGGTCQTGSYTQCIMISENTSATITCPGGTKVSSITFASYGTPNGTCGSFSTSGCHAANSSTIVSSACLNQTSCTLSASNGTYGDPCSGTFKRLYVQVACSC